MFGLLLKWTPFLGFSTFRSLISTSIILIIGHLYLATLQTTLIPLKSETPAFMVPGNLIYSTVFFHRVLTTPLRY